MQVEYQEHDDGSASLKLESETGNVTAIVISKMVSILIQRGNLSPAEMRSELYAMVDAVIAEIDPVDTPSTTP